MARKRIKTLAAEWGVSVDEVLQSFLGGDVGGNGDGALGADVVVDLGDRGLTGVRLP